MATAIGIGGPVWGAARIEVHADGSTLAREVRLLARQAGAAGGREFGRSFSTAATQELGRRLNTAVRRNVPAFRSLRREVDGLAKSTTTLNRSWRRLPHGFRQGVFWTNAIIGALPQLGPLTAAAAGGILILGGAVASFGVGLGVTAVAFSRFAGDIDDVPAELLPARKAFDRFTASVDDLADALTVSAFRKTEKAWDSLADTVRELTPAFEVVGEAVNRLIVDLAENLKPGTRAFQELDGFVRRSAPIFEGLMRTVGKLGLALLTAFNDPAMQRALEGLVGWVDDLVQGFDDWVQSPLFGSFMDNVVTTFENLGGLLETIGEAFSTLVDDDAFANLNAFIDDLDRFIAGPGAGLLEFAEELNVFGLIAEALADVGEALEPLQDPLVDLAGALNDIVDIAIDTFTAQIGPLADVVGAMASSIDDFLSENPDIAAASMEAIGVALGSIASALVVFKLTKWAKVVGGLVTIAGVKGLAKNAAGIAGLALALDQLGAALDENKDMDAGLSALGGALIGLRAAGPAGALVGTLVGLVASMIDDVFLSPETKGAWQNGWDQLFDPNNYTGAGIGPLKQWFQNNLMGPTEGIPESGGGWLEQVVTNWQNTLTQLKDEWIPGFWESLGTAFSDGWASVAAWYDTEFGQPIETFWNDTVRFFTVEVPTFFGNVGTWFKEGWDAVAEWYDVNFGQPIERFWNDTVSFFTTKVPAFFAKVGAWFESGWRTVSSWFHTNFVTPVEDAWNGFVAFLTVEVPRFFQGIWSTFLTWLDRLTAPFRSFFADVERNWNAFWSGLGAIVGTVWSSITSGVRTAVNTVIGWINSMIRAINRGLDAIRTISGGLINVNIPTLPGMASGGILYRPTRILAGESGAEAIVPLSRPLSQVDPSVRNLSAIAQGRAAPTVQKSDVVASRVVNNNVTIVRPEDPWRTAIEVVNRMTMVAIN